MREIKFRARHKETGKWYYGSSLITDINQGDEYTLTLSLFWLQIEKGWLDPETVGQYTGHNDKNGVEIYEGDIVSFGEWSNQKSHPGLCLHKVVWNEEDACFSTYEARETMTYGLDPFSEVIGNIYENPELLEVTTTK